MKPIPARNSQRGVVLAVVLILLLVMTLLAVASLSGTVLEERMGTAQLDRNLSLQAAEAAMREAEEIVRGKPAMPAVGAACDAGLCPRPDPSEPGDPDEWQRWMNDALWEDPDQYGVAEVDLGDVTASPRYIIELLDDAVKDDEICTTGGDVSLEASCTLTSSRYRITVRSAEEGRAVVMLQSIYVMP